MSSFSGGSKVQMERVVSIVDAIQGGSFPNCSSLAKELEVSAKTIQRDITFIRDRLNYPVEYDEQEYGYCFIREVDGLAKFDVQVEDLAALFLAKQTMGALKGTKLATAMQPSFEKLSQMMDGKVSLSARDLDEVFSAKVSGVVEADLTIFGKLAEAVLKQQSIVFSYENLKGELGKRRIHPYHVGDVNGGWYLVGYDEEKLAMRTFALQRIKALEITKEKFERERGFEVENYFAGGVGVWSGEGSYAVKMEVSGWVARLVKERIWHPSQEVRNLDRNGDFVEVTMHLTALEDVVSLILSWGSKVKVREPKKLLEMLREEVTNMQH